MIFTERTITVVNDSATINKPLILYRGDKNIELKITIVESQFKFRSTGASNVIETANASYAQLVIDTPYDLPIFSEITATENGTVIFVISAAMIDEVREVGIYDIQIRLLDDSKQSRASIPPVSNAIEIREPIAIEDGSAVDSNAVNAAKVNRALTTTSAPLEVFDSQGNYIKKTWGDGDPITDAALNKMEAGIDGVNKKIANVNNINDTTASTTTTYSSNKIENIKETLDSQIKDIANSGGSGIIFKDIAADEIFELKSSTITEEFGDVIISVTSLTLNEGASNTFTVKLDKSPTNSQIINLSANNSDCIIDKSSLNFTSINYNVEQTVTVTGVHDANSYVDKNSIITLSNPNITSKSLNVTIKNIDENPSSGELNLSITDGLTHLYDFQTLTSNSTVSEDLVGTANITYGSGFATDGGILSKSKHLNCGNLLDNEFTAFLTTKIDNNYDSRNPEYSFYCGDRTICATSNKIGTSLTAWENRQLHEGILYTLGIKWDDTTKTMYSYINGELILASTNTSFNSNDRDVYISFDTNSNTAKNYNLAIYNKQLSDDNIKTISSELYNRVSSDKTNAGLSITDNLQAFYDMINIGESATYIESKVGEHRLNIANGYTFNNGLIINNSGSYLSEADKAPHDNQFTYFLKSIIPSTSTNGNKLIESQKAVLSGNKTSLSLTVAGVSTTPISPELDVSNVVAISVDNINKQAKLYYKGVLKQTITFTDDCLAMNGDYYMLKNDMVHQYLVLYDRILTDEEVATITSELEGM